MNRQSKYRRLPYWIAVTILFVLAVLAPRVWEPGTPQQPTADETPPPAEVRVSLDPPPADTDTVADLAASADKEDLDVAAIDRPLPPVEEAPVAPTFSREVPRSAIPQITLDAPLLVEEPVVQIVPVEPTPAVGFAPASLIERLEKLSAEYEASRGWCEEMLSELARLSLLSPAEFDKAADCLRKLRNGIETGRQLSDELADEQAAAATRRTVHALLRRLDFWEQLQAAEQGESLVHHDLDAGAQRVHDCLARLAVLDHAEGAAGDWRKYLLLDELRFRTEERQLAEPESSVELARLILARLHQANLTPAQRQFVTSGPLGELHASLYDMAEMDLTGQMLRQQVERYEQSRSNKDAQVLVASLRRLQWSGLPKDEELKESVEQHFRNTNVRFVVSQKLLDRMVPEQEPRFDRVYDRVLGLPVRGRSLTETDLTLKPLPATGDQRMRFLLSAQGTTSSQTRSYSGNVVAHSSTCARFEAFKQFEMSEQGLVALPAQVSVLTNSNIRDVQTGLEGIPLVGSIAHDYAMSRAEESRAAAQREVRQKIAAKVRRQLDQEADQAIARVNGPLHKHVLLPFGEMALEPAAIVSHPVEDRVSVRLRLASSEQLGAHTPRPRAMSNSLASVQVHESALNNAVAQLQLGGETMTTSELVARLAGKFRLPEEMVPALEEDATLRFATTDPIHFLFENGVIRLTLHLDEFAASRYLWSDLTVMVNYRPQPHGVGVELVRDGPVQLSARRLNLRSQFLLRGIFSRIFSDNRQLELLEEGWTTQPGLADLGISQCVVEDGWIGLSFVPQSELPGITRGRMAHKPLSLRR